MLFAIVVPSFNGESCTKEKAVEWDKAGGKHLVQLQQPLKNTKRLELDELQCFEVINYSNDMLNEYSLGLLLNQAPKLLELNLSNVEAFNRPGLRAQIFNRLFLDRNI